MFTIKHRFADGVVRASSCDTYERRGSTIVAKGYRAGSPFSDVIEVGPGEIVFIENERGNTTDTIRGKRDVAA
jgi:hypothetical protein